MYKSTRIFAGYIVLSCMLKNCESCINNNICTECVVDINCAWCIRPKNGSSQHCFKRTEISAICPNHLIVDPKSSETVVANKSISTADLHKPVQIRPQEVRLSLRKGDEYVLEFEYGQAHDFPVDMYYLMDLSASMNSTKNQVAENGVRLVKLMNHITSDFRIGFGSFVDKTDAPFIDTRPDKIRHPCTGCVQAYSFIHHLSLTDDGNTFSREVHRAKVSGNLDVPEGGFDALMQVMVCSERIGWRTNSKRIIVFATDALFHVAGDGKLAGVVIPNDARCHLDGNNSYSEALKYDYPSISHINFIAKQNNFNIMFIVVSKVLSVYRHLEKAIENSRVVELNNQAAINIEIKKFYQDISTTLRIEANSSQNVYVDFEANCAGEEFQRTSECLNVVADQRIQFKATIKAMHCLKVPEEFYIKSSTENVFMKVILSTNCECDCGQVTTAASECDKHGDLICGICQCHPGYNGNQCECNQANGEDYLKDTDCKMGNDTENCSGRGSCLCNVCHCEKRPNPEQIIDGKFCECDNYSCPKEKQVLCNNQGDCNCGECKCYPNWSGNACQCKNDNTTCSSEGKVCNEHGLCDCGKCKCNKGYFGRFCEECSTCFGGKCSELTPCVECRVHSKGPYLEECDIKCHQYAINIANEIQDSESEDVKICRVMEDNCRMIFSYRYENEKIIVTALKELQCSISISAPVLVSTIIGSILLFGIVTLIIWKVWTNYKDGIEYAKFEDERMRARWNTENNPIFISPVTKHRNPLFRTGSFLSKRSSGRQSTTS